MADDKYGYIPPSIQRQMDQSLQHMPANLQKYQGGNTYIPQKAAQEIAGYMKKSMPAHMQEYITPYMERQTQAGMKSLDPGMSRTVSERAPAPDLMRRDHSAYGEQFSVNMESAGKHGSLSYSPQYSGQQAQPTPAPQPTTSSAGNQTPYDFILNHSPKKPGLFGGSFKNRVIFVAAGGIVLVIAAIIFASLLGGGGNASALVELSEQQQELIRVSTLGEKQSGASQATQNLAITTQLAVQTDQTKTLAQLKKTGHKVKSAQLNLKKNSSTDQQLAAAAQNNGFDAAFAGDLQTQLKSYRASLQQAYKASASQSEKNILRSSFNSASYLLGDSAQ
ncbi:MAG TPA: hypothetical protein VLF90_03845 [Patescibacteria group bacterium]|nr:hypothetical protein [Patescibacteria group bacterium]